MSHTPAPLSKTTDGNFFEDFAVGQQLVHATPRTVTAGDASLYMALFGARFAATSSAPFAAAIGLPDAPLDSLLVFHMVFGKTVPDISLNAIANLGYAEGRFGVPVFAGDTLRTVSEVIGLKENSNGRTGVVYVRSRGENQRGEMVLEYVRWVMVRKRDVSSPAPERVVPTLAPVVPPETLQVPYRVRADAYDTALAGSPHVWDDYVAGERIDHVDGITIEEAEHMMAARLFQNTARVHFNQHVEQAGRFGRRIVYGGHLISMARALSFNGLGNAFAVVGINAGHHLNPTFAGDTIYAWTEVRDVAPLPARTDAGVLRLRTVATRDLSCAAFPDRDDAGVAPPEMVLELDYWAVLPRRGH